MSKAYDINDMGFFLSKKNDSLIFVSNSHFMQTPIYVSRETYIVYSKMKCKML